MVLMNMSTLRYILIGFILVFTVRTINAEPEPFPADDAILELVEQVSQDRFISSIQSLVGFHTRHTYSDTTSDTLGIDAARRWMISQFEDSDVPAERYPWRGFWDREQYPCYNVHAVLESEDNQDRMVILGAHLDSRTRQPNDNTGFAPGADDDGSGCIALLEIGRILADEALNASIVLAAFTGEEQGLLGSRAFAEELHDDGANVSAMINMDMIGHIIHPNHEVDSTTVRVFSTGPSTSSSRQLARYIKWVGEAYSDGLEVNIIPAQDRGGRSGDHIPFSDNGFPAARVIETAEDVDFQHNPDDSPENISISYAARVTRMVLGVTAVIASAPDTPPAPVIRNAGDGHSLLVSLPDSLEPPDDGTVWIAHRESDDIYWQDIHETNDDLPYLLTGLEPEGEYLVSISVSSENGLPSLFSLEAEGVPDSIPKPPDNFETTSTDENIVLQWKPRVEINTDTYLIERASRNGDFQQVASIRHPDSAWVDDNLDLGRLYYYRIRTRNSLDSFSEWTLIQEGRLASHHLGVLVVDATPDGESIDRPDDEAVDGFYAEVLASYDLTAQWDRSDSLRIESTISDADLAPYQLVLVHADGINSSFSRDTTALRKYISNGGRVLMVGLRLSYAVGGRRGYENSFNGGDFLKDLCGIDSIRVAHPGSPWFIGAEGLAGYPDLEFDFERIPDREGQLLMDAIWTDSPPEGTEIIATFMADRGDESDFHGRPVALRESGENPRWILVDIPAYNMTLQTSIPFLRRALDELQAPFSEISEDLNHRLPLTCKLYPAYPNPFNPSVTISYQLSRDQNTLLRIFDLNGREVYSHASKLEKAGYHNLSWNAESLPAGVYLCRLEAGAYSETIKFVLVR